MRIMSLIVVLLVAARPAAAAENTLTPREVADGWLLLFDGDSSFGWTAPTDSGWTIAQGMIAPQAGKSGLLVTSTAFGDYVLQLDYRVRPDSKVTVTVRCDPHGKTDVSGDTIQLPYQGEAWTRMNVRITGKEPPSPSFETLSSGLFGASASGSFGFVQSEEPKPRRGHIALSGNGVVFRNIKVQPVGLNSIFNHRDLSGWKVFPGDKYRSKFTVADGVLTVKDGPGDLQTEGQWGDFVLQLECRSNGQHLNSGIFFRCQPDKYQQGYEAQIRNQFGEQLNDYTVEEYDPKTNQLKEKKTVKSLAVDYGTGAIYRRMPARRGVSKDGEWFTMTVVADGRHLATWVNGFPVADWTDNRPLADNARNGCRLEKGPISIQGHDPTTDLSFRNFRIAELPARDAK